MTQVNVYKVPTFGHEGVYISIKLLILDTVVFTVTRTTIPREGITLSPRRTTL
jgi:hypothetical protein